MNQRPQSFEEFQALPVGPLFGCMVHELTAEDRANGYTLIGDRRVSIAASCHSIHIPIQPDVVCFHSEDNDLLSYSEHGENWLLGRYASGEWFRKRC